MRQDVNACLYFKTSPIMSRNTKIIFSSHKLKVKWPHFCFTFIPIDQPAQTTPPPFPTLLIQSVISPSFRILAVPTGQRQLGFNTKLSNSSG